PGGRVLKEDVMREAARTEQPPARPQPPEQPVKPPAAQRPAPSGDGEEEVVRMSPMRRRIAQRLVEAQQTAALLTTFNEVDMTAVMALRTKYRDDFEKKRGVRLGFMSFFVKASIEALKFIPQVNAEI